MKFVVRTGLSRSSWFIKDLSARDCLHQRWGRGQSSHIQAVAASCVSN